MVDIDADEHVGLEFAGDDGAAEAADLLVGRDREHHAGVLQLRRPGDELGELGADEAAEAVVEVGAVEGVLAESVADRAVEEDRVTGADAELLDLFFRVVTVRLEFEVEHLRLDPGLAEAHFWWGKVDRAEGFDGAALEDAVLADLARVAAEQQHLVADQRRRQILPSLPMLRTCMRILSAWPMIITEVRSSSPGWVSTTMPALPRNWWMPQLFGMIFSK